ncbi:MAG: urate hydroxylase PuuD [Gemmatimonadales bacterium]
MIELADLLARWVHVIAGIMWIGNSLLFNWLDRRLEAPSGLTRTPVPSGTIWLLHSGGFYYVEKTLLGGTPLPRVVHWFKWQAYTTWWSGLALLVVVYYLGGRAVLADGGAHSTAVLAGAGGIAAGWLFYEAMQRLVAPRWPRAATIGWIGGLAAFAGALVLMLSGRAGFLHVGAMLGTIMAGNVVFTIVPSQRELVAAVAGGRGGDPAVAERAKRVSLHNNYFTFPVIALMLIGHFPVLYGHPQRWLVLTVLVAGGVLTRYLLNLRFTWPAWRPALAATIGGTALALYGLIRVGMSEMGVAEPVGSPVARGPVSLAEVRHVIDRRCGPCHSATPSDRSFGVAPGGVSYDTPDQIVKYADRIRERAVLTRTMPPGNKTGLTEAERALLARWTEPARRR